MRPPDAEPTEEDRMFAGALAGVVKSLVLDQPPDFKRGRQI
jgi:hypothetical protein